jgi:hypothetical protein
MIQFWGKFLTRKLRYGLFSAWTIEVKSDEKSVHERIMCPRTPFNFSVDFTSRIKSGNYTTFEWSTTSPHVLKAETIAPLHLTSGKKDMIRNRTWKKWYDRESNLYLDRDNWRVSPTPEKLFHHRSISKLCPLVQGMSSEISLSSRTCRWSLQSSPLLSFFSSHYSAIESHDRCVFQALKHPKLCYI